MQDRCLVCVERTIGSKIILDAPDGTLGEWVMWNLVSVRLETVLVSVQDTCPVCVKRTLGSEIDLDALDDTPRSRGSCGSVFESIWR
jgi:hypothetical protein